MLFKDSNLNLSFLKIKNQHSFKGFQKKNQNSKLNTLLKGRPEGTSQAKRLR